MRDDAEFASLCCERSALQRLCRIPGSTRQSSEVKQDNGRKFLKSLAAQMLPTEFILFPYGGLRWGYLKTHIYDTLQQLIKLTWQHYKEEENNVFGTVIITHLESTYLNMTGGIHVNLDSLLWLSQLWHTRSLHNMWRSAHTVCKSVSSTIENKATD